MATLSIENEIDPRWLKRIDRFEYERTHSEWLGDGSDRQGEPGVAAARRDQQQAPPTVPSPDGSRGGARRAADRGLGLVRAGA
jgi:hypothetical protein